MTKVTCMVVTPEATALEEVAEFVALPLYDGEVGIGGNHSAMIGRLGFGELRLRTGSDVKRYYIDGGFVQVADNVVSVLTERAVPVADLRRSDAERQLAEALKMPAATAEQQEARNRRMVQARAQMRVARG
ncbi:MAG: ATP synthase F1 subunit epsilon [Planctomycetales bacterium]|nr:ATP synthase F1 subunit epsilon [Planctomycetales bacterium]